MKFRGQESIELINQNKSKFFIIILAHLPTLYFDSLTWITLMNKSKLSLIWSLIITWIAQASGKFLPTGTITGEFLRVYLGIKKGLTPQEASSSVFADLIIATFSLFILALISLIYLVIKNENFFQVNIVIFFFGLFYCFVGCILFIFSSKKDSQNIL